MALSLDQVNSVKKKNKVTEVEAEPQKIRPWETKKEINITHSGVSAVKKAQDIAQKNNEMVEDLRGDFVSKEKALEIDQMIEKKNEDFDNLVKEASDINQIKSHRGIMGRLRRIFL